MYKFDYVYLGIVNKDVVVVFYGELGKFGFIELYEKLKFLLK